MKKSLLLLFALIALLVFSLPVFAKGGIEDGDAFDTYMGKTMEEVKAIAPYFEQETEQCYEIDSNDICSLTVMFGENGKVESLFLVMKIGLSDYADDPIFQIKAVIVGLRELGISNRELLDIDTIDSDKVIIFDDDIYCRLIESRDLTFLEASYYEKRPRDLGNHENE